MDSERIASAAENQGGEARVALPVRQPPKRRTNKEEIAGTALASIPLIGFLIFGLVPLVLAMAMAFMKMQDFGFEGAEWAGLENFKTVLTDPMFWDSVVNTLWMGHEYAHQSGACLDYRLFPQQADPRQKSVQNDLFRSLRLLGGRGDVDVEIYV